MEFSKVQTCFFPNSLDCLFSIGFVEIFITVDVFKYCEVFIVLFFIFILGTGTLLFGGLLLGFHKSIQTPVNTHNVSYVFWNLLRSKDFKKYFPAFKLKLPFLMQVSTNEYNNGYMLMITHTQASLYISTYIYSSALRCDYFCDFVL